MTKNISNESTVLQVSFGFENKAPNICVVEDLNTGTTSQSPLNPAEKKRLTKCEKAIKKGKKAFLEVGNALREIKAGKLYRVKYNTFAEYCEKEWKFCRVTANRYAEASKVDEALKKEPNGTVAIPNSVSQCRSLNGKPADTIIEVAKKVKDKVGDGKATAKDFEDAMAEICLPKIKQDIQKDEPDGDPGTDEKGGHASISDDDLCHLVYALEDAKNAVESGGSKEKIMEYLNEALQIVFKTQEQLCEPEAKEAA
jgi:hypothetical protein